jgi:L-lysine exporter family protein LysE/ArgO
MSDDGLLTPLGTGFGTGAGLIIAIGAQNAFIITQGLKRQYALTVAGICTGIDVVLIIAGVLGMGALINRSALLLQAALWLGALFLLWYGTRALHSALQAHSLHADRRGVSGQRQAVLTSLALSLLNPHVYLDTVVLLGSIGGQFPPTGQLAFIAGAGAASSLWFFSLALGARQLAPLFARPLAWRVLDTLIWLVMWAIAAMLLHKALFG